jgi:hypothetical protein
MKTIPTDINNVDKLQDENSEQFFAVEDVFDKIDKTFIDFYGEYGQKIVNERRKEWNQNGNWKFKPAENL